MNLAKRHSYKWFILCITYLLMLSFSISLQSLPPLFGEIAKDIPISTSQSGLLMGAYAIPGVFLPFLTAYLANQFNKKSIILISLFTMITGLVGFSISKSFALLLVFRLMAGVGATALVVLAPLLITIFFDKKNMGVAMGIFNTAVPFGTVLAANLFGAVGSIVPWRIIIIGIAAFITIVLAIGFFLMDIPEDQGREKSDSLEKSSSSSFWSNGQVWLLASIWALANAQMIAYVTFGPEFFQNLGMTVQRAGFISSFIMLVPIFVSPFIGIIMDKTGWKKPFILIGSLTIGIAFLLLAKLNSAVSLWSVLLGLGFSPIPVLVFSLLPEVVEPEWTGMGLGMLTSASNLGIAVGPSGFGFLLDNTKGNFSLGFIVLALMSFLMITIGTRLKLKNPVE